MQSAGFLRPRCSLRSHDIYYPFSQREEAEPSLQAAASQELSLLGSQSLGSEQSQSLLTGMPRTALPCRKCLAAEG